MVRDIESQVFTGATEALKLVDPDVVTLSTPDDIPESLPCVVIDEMSNVVDDSYTETQRLEVRVNLVYQVDIYTNDVNGKKARAKRLRKAISEYFDSIGFYRTFSERILNFTNPDIFRYSLRFSASFDGDTTSRR